MMSKSIKNPFTNRCEKKDATKRYDGVKGWPSQGQEVGRGIVIRLSDDKIIRGSEDSEDKIRIFGKIFGDSEIRRKALHADPVGRRMT